jgi:hypothetical protein
VSYGLFQKIIAYLDEEGIELGVLLNELVNCFLMVVVLFLVGFGMLLLLLNKFLWLH